MRTAVGRVRGRVPGSAQIRLTYWRDRDVRSFTFTARAVTRSMEAA